MQCPAAYYTRYYKSPFRVPPTRSSVRGREGKRQKAVSIMGDTTGANAAELPRPSLAHPVAPDPQRLDVATNTFRMLADPTRLHILAILADTAADVTTLTEACGVSRTAVSQHLAKLRFTGLV